MTDAAWIKGMAELAAAFPAKDQDQAVMATRGQVYRRELGRLTDTSWRYAVSQAVQHERWFPTVAALLDYATDAPDELPKAGLLTQGEPVSREEFRRGFDEIFKPALEAHGIDLTNGAKDMPGGK